jgi:EmrB/QacA subfamily drug resistance transporter
VAVSSADIPAIGASGDKFTRRMWGTLFVLCGALFLDALDVSMIGVALPSIKSSLDMSTSSLQWVVSAYVLGYGGFLLLGGRAADLLGRRQVFLIALTVFIVASTLSGLANDGTLLIATRFIKGVSAAFTAPAALSIITTSFAEGRARNKALAVFTATGAVGFSLGLVFGGILTDIGWRWVFFMPAPVALVVLIAGLKLVPRGRATAGSSRSLDVFGAVSMTSAMLLLVFTLVEAPAHGFLSARTLGSLAAVALIFAAFVWRERRAASPLVRLGILRSGNLVRANLGAMALFGGWVGFQFVTTLYLQGIRGWSPLETGLAIFPGGALVVLLSPAILPLISRLGTTRLIAVGLLSAGAGYALFLRIGLDSTYLIDMLPTFLLAGVGFALAFGPLNVAATSGVAAEEQGLAGGLLNTSFQFGGALVLAIVTAVNNAYIGAGGGAQAVLDGFHAALYVSVAASLFGIVALLARGRVAVAPAGELPLEEIFEEAA